MSRNRPETEVDPAVAAGPAPVAVLDAPRVPKVGERVHLHSRAWLRDGGKSHTSRPATVAAVKWHPGRPSAELDLVVEREDRYEDAQPVRKADWGVPNRMLGRWALVDEDGRHAYPEREIGVDDLPSPGDHVFLFTHQPEYKGIAPVPARVVANRDSEFGGPGRGLDLIVIEAEVIPNVPPAEDPADPGDRTWSWSPAPDPEPGPEPDPNPEP